MKYIGLFDNNEDIVTKEKLDGLKDIFAKLDASNIPSSNSAAWRSTIRTLPGIILYGKDDGGIIKVYKDAACTVEANVATAMDLSDLRNALFLYNHNTYQCVGMQESVSVAAAYIVPVFARAEVTTEGVVVESVVCDIIGYLSGSVSAPAILSKQTYSLQSLPTVTAADNGKFLKVVNGAWIATGLPSTEDRYYLLQGSLFEGTLGNPPDDCKNLCADWYGALADGLLGNSDTVQNIPNPVICCPWEDNPAEGVVDLRISGFEQSNKCLVFSGFYDDYNQNHYAVSLVYSVDSGSFVRWNFKELTIPQASTTTPSAPTADGAVGTSTEYARADHSHPKQSVSKSDVGLGNVDNVSINTRLNRTTNVNEADTNYTTYMARGEALFSSETTPSVNGCIAWQYG